VVVTAAVVVVEVVVVVVVAAVFIQQQQRKVLYLEISSSCVLHRPGKVVALLLSADRLHKVFVFAQTIASYAPDRFRCHGFNATIPYSPLLQWVSALDIRSVSTPPNTRAVCRTLEKGLLCED